MSASGAARSRTRPKRAEVPTQGHAGYRTREHVPVPPDEAARLGVEAGARSTSTHPKCTRGRCSRLSVQVRLRRMLPQKEAEGDLSSVALRTPLRRGSSGGVYEGGVYLHGEGAPEERRQAT